MLLSQILLEWAKYNASVSFYSARIEQSNIETDEAFKIYVVLT